MKELNYLEETAGVLVKKIKPDFKKLGPKFGKEMKQVAAAINQLSQEQIASLEASGNLAISVNNNAVQIDLADVEVSSEDIPGWLVATEGKYTVALDVTISEELKEEGIAREIVNRIQNFRKEAGFDIVDKINLTVQTAPQINEAIENNKDYICSETLAQSLVLVDEIADKTYTIEIDNETTTFVSLTKV